MKSCRVRTGRSIRGLCLPPAICRAERVEVEQTLADALAGLSGDLAGKYYPLCGMTPEQEKQLIEVFVDFNFKFNSISGHVNVFHKAMKGSVNSKIRKAKIQLRTIIIADLNILLEIFTC